MTVEIAHFCLILAFAAAMIQSIIPMVGAVAYERGHADYGHRLMSVAGPTALAQLLLVALALFGLGWAFVTSDFSVKTVFDNSHTAKPLIYKVAGVWGNHEGSMLLWIFMLAFLGAMVAGFARHLPLTFRARVLGVQGIIGVCFLAFSLLTSNPFARLAPVPLNGRDLNPLLQDPGLAFHPPFLYFGYVGFSVAFAFAVAALLEGRVGPGWARWVRPWTLLAWSSLTLGIAMGAWWAYYELGWGGFWFWDPVENASLMPWLAGTALLHSAIVVEKRDTLKVWTLLMAIIAFATSLMGTFLVRSGLLTSVHAFANDPLRGQFLLMIFVALTGGALFLFALKAARLQPGGRFELVSREGALIGNNIILSIILFAVILGTFWPSLFQYLFGRPVSVGPPYFNAITIPLMALLSVLMVLGTLSPWKRAKPGAVLDRIKIAAVLAVGLALLAGWLTRGGPVFAALGAFMAVWIMIGTFIDILGRAGVGRVTLRQALQRLPGLPTSFWGGAVAHMGVGIAILGMTGTAIWVSENSALMNPGDRLAIAGYDLVFERVGQAEGPNYVSERATFRVERKGNTIARLVPERRYYPVAEQPTTEAAFRPVWASDIYVALGEKRDDGYVVRAWFHPMVSLMWGGAILIAFGGVVAIAGARSRRIPAPVRTSSVSTPALEPAEG